jgi:hypothetical protein
VKNCSNLKKNWVNESEGLTSPGEFSMLVSFFNGYTQIGIGTIEIETSITIWLFNIAMENHLF